jgi:hypothetical protein
LYKRCSFLLQRPIVSTLVFFAVQAFSYWAVYAPIFAYGIKASQPFRATAIAALLTAVVAVVWVWRGMGASEWGILTTVAVWAVVAGAVSFCLGFYGPIIFAPGANQGPLLGIFITGPLGFIMGGICGLTLWHRAKVSAI